MIVLRNLGCANAWDDYAVDPTMHTPSIILSCISLKHTRKHEAIGQRLLQERVWCEKCGYEYTVDAS